MIRVVTKFSVKYAHGRFLQPKSTLVKVKCCLSQKIPSESYELFLLDDGPSTETELELQDALHYYKDMQVIRKMENVASQLYTQKRIRGFLHLYSGQEACCVGIKAGMLPDDTIVTSYRCHGWVVVMGDTPYRVISELLGNVTGNSRGKGGSMHMYYKNFYGGSGIVGSHVPLGTGIGFAQKYLQIDAVSFTVFGDGATNQGQTHESFNLAKLHGIPTVFVIENNHYGMATSLARSSASSDFYKRGCYIPGIRVDGMDILAVREAAKFSRDFALKNGPIILELITYRYFGHSMSDPGKSYRSTTEIKSWRENRDPIKSFEKRLIQSDMVNEEKLKNIEKEAKEEVTLAVEKALKDEEPDIKELVCDCYASYPDLIRTPEFLSYRPHKHYGYFKASTSN